MARAANPSASPPRRRVTRSQSRDVEDPTSGNAFRSKGTRQVPGNAKASSNRLSIVGEERETSTSSRQTSVLGLGTSVVPESPGNPEGNSNISGTTFLPQDSSFEDGELDAIVMVDELQDLQNAAHRLLEVFVSNASDPRNVLDAARRLTNPRNTASKRLKPAANKLISTMKGFSSQAFIDVAQVKELVPSVQPKDAAQPWSPLPILHRANCARLALDVLLVSIGSRYPRQAIEKLEKEFPAPFMDNIVKRSQPKPVGASAAEKPTFELALEIRTQYFIMELERRQNEKDFDPLSILRGVFYHKSPLDDDSHVEPGSLRGFKLPRIFEDENERLPDRFQDDVIDRIGELEYDLLDVDGALNIQGLKRASWTRFVQRTARFVHTRDKEIKFDLQNQAKLDEVEDLVRKEIERRDNPESQQTPDRREPTIPGTGERPPRPLSAREDPEIQAEQSVNETPQRPQESRTTGTRSLASPSISVGQESSASYTPQPSTKDPSGRKSSKILRKLGHSFDILEKRQEEERRKQDLSHLESQPPGRLSGTTAHSFSQRPAMSTAQTNEEIPPSPPQMYPPGAESPLPSVDDGNFNLNEELQIEAESTTSPALQRNRKDGFFFDEPSTDRTQPSQPQSSAAVVGAIRDGPAPRGNFIDRQANASRVSFDSPGTDPQSVERRAQAATQSSSRKRNRVASDSDDSDDSDDDLFVRDDRNIDTAARRAQKPQQSRPVDKRPRIDRSDESDAANQLQQNLTASSQTQPAPIQPAPSTQISTQIHAGRPSSTTRWLQMNSLPAGTEPPASSQRFSKRWTEEEDDRLIMLMERHATGWADIKRQDDLCPAEDGGPKLTHRTQVNLKDRARNLKKKFHREGRDLPRNFEKVTGPA